MKKTLLLTLIALLCAGMLFAAESMKYTRYGKIFNSGEFTLKGTSCDLDSSGNRSGEESSFTLSVHAGEFYMDTPEARLLKKADGKLYVIDDSSKSVMVMSSDMQTLIQYPPFIEPSSTGNAKLDGRNLYYEKVKADGKEVVYWFNGNDLYAIEDVEDSQRNALFVSSFSEKADSSLYSIPTGYEVIDLSSFGAGFNPASMGGAGFGY